MEVGTFFFLNNFRTYRLSLFWVHFSIGPLFFSKILIKKKQRIQCLLMVNLFPYLRIHPTKSVHMSVHVFKLLFSYSVPVETVKLCFFFALLLLETKFSVGCISYGCLVFSGCFVVFLLFRNFKVTFYYEKTWRESKKKR